MLARTAVKTVELFSQKYSSAALAISTIVLGVENSNLRESSTATTLPSTTPTPSTTTPFPPSTTPTPNMDRFRLPKTTVPISYDLYFYPDLETGLFKGKVKTRANLSEPTTEILMHNNQLKIDKVLVNNTEAKVEIDTQFENLIITNVDDKKFPKSILDIDIEFSGDLKNRIVGFYRSSYTGQDGVKRFIATSKFEPTYARQAYPCFDEPNLKATYKVHILKPKDSHYIALSNNPQSSEEDTDNGVLVHFDETVPMSTYLSCFIVCDFEFSQTEFENGGKKTPFRVYASPGQQEKTQYAGEVGASVIQYFVNYFNIPYPLPKLDLIAIPDFVSGAMEHWGLVTFRETSLLYTNQTHSSANKQRVATVVAHELSHSWFGNLVTMDWWNNLWLNEGFASYIEYKGVDHVHPDWGMLDQFLIEDLHNILDLDATQSSHPIIQTVTTPDQITEVFDTVSYSKGASVLRMLESVVGEENFRNGVTNYLKRFSYSNAVTQDLLDELQKIVGDSINITEFMNTFTTQTGYPILDVKIEGGNYVLTQKRFLSDPESSGSPSQLGYKWSVPVTYKTDKTNSPIFWFKQNDSKLTIEKPTNNSWLKFNPGQVGYYRVNYPVEEWTNLAKIIKDLSVADRTHLLEESFSIAASGDLNYTVPLELTKYLVDELHFVPWSVASLKLKTIVDYLKYSESESKIKNYIIGLLKPAYANLSWTEIADEEHLRRRARVVVLSLACAMDYEEALLKAGDLFTEWINGTGELSQDLRSIIYKYGMVNADEQTWNKLFDKFAKETDANEKLKLMYGLTSVQKPSLLVKLIDLAKDETYVRGQDYFTLLGYISVNPIGVPIVWDYVREHWTDLVGRFTLNDRYLGRLLPTITSSFSTELKFEEMQQFFEKYPEAGAGASARRQALEQVRNNIKWLSKYKTTVSGWINTQ